MKSTTLTVILSCIAALPASVGAEDKAAPKPEDRKVLFGEEHMHTRNSFDAFTAGVTATWDDAYNFAKGQEVALSTTGEKMKRRTPYDFVAITDHSEYFGVLKSLIDPASPLSKSDFAKQLQKMRTDPKAAGPAVQQLIQTLVKNEPMEEYVTPELRHSFWQKFIETADKHNDPGKFTALYAFEWTSIPNGANMHRNVFFKDTPPASPFSSFDSVVPEDLWTYLEIQREQLGIECFAIPHNSNVSDGWMFSERKYIGSPRDAQYASRNLGAVIDTRYARRQQENEPLFEICQTKGNSEAHPWLSPNDEFAKFEQFGSLISLDSASAVKGGFYRQGLVEGMRLEVETGFNPYKMGVTAGADVHSGYQGNEEWDWKGAHGTMDDTPAKRLNPVKNATGETGFVVSSAGTTAVWADENTRAGIFEAMERKETYGTTGTLIRLRFFGGWDYPKDLTTQDDWVKKAYTDGVPMGRDLPTMPTAVKAPTFAVWAQKDPESGNLDRVQIVKGWINPRTGFPAEKIYDVVWSDEDKRSIDPSGKLPAVGNTVDVKTATFSNDSIGASQLRAEWTDPDFDHTRRAVYYVRVLEIPTPRWSTYDAAKLGVSPPEGVPATIQERAYSSPIWYTPHPKVDAGPATEGAIAAPIEEPGDKK